jgi:hypothetical protein
MLVYSVQPRRGGALDRFVGSQSCNGTPSYLTFGRPGVSLCLIVAGPPEYNGTRKNSCDGR